MSLSPRNPCDNNALSLASAKTRLTLLAAEDRNLYRTLYTSTEIMRTVALPLTLEAANAQFERVIQHNMLIEPGHRAWRIERLADNASLGLAALLRHGARAEYGIMLLPEAWQRGIATDTFSILLPYAFMTLGLEAIDVSRADDEHVYVLDRMFAPFALRRAPGLRPGEVGWSLSRSEWLEQVVRPR